MKTVGWLGRITIGLALCVGFLLLSRAARAVCPGSTVPSFHEQTVGSDFMTVAAERPSGSLTGWTKTTPPGAYRGAVLKAGTTNATVVYQLQFHTPGTYKLNIRGKGSSSTTNSIRVPGGGDPESAPSVGFDFGTTWQWRGESALPYYVVEQSDVNRLIQFQVKLTEPDVEVDEIFFGLVGVTFDRDAAYAHEQAADGSITFEAEAFDRLSGDYGWSAVDDTLSHGRKVLKASSSATGSDLKGIATYRVLFHTVGFYSVYVRARATSGTTDSLYLPSALDTDPASPWTTIIPSNDTWTWVSKVLNVTDAEVVKELRIGVREPDARFDSVVIVPASETAERLDARSGYWEAELSTNTTGVLPTDDPAKASGGKRVSSFTSIGDQFSFADVPATDRLLVRYSLGETTSKRASVYVNGVDVDTVIFSPTGGWNQYATTTIRGYFHDNVMLRIDPDDFVANQGLSSASIDRMSLRDSGRECVVGLKADFDPATTWARPGDAIVFAKGADLTKTAFLLPSSVGGTADQPITIRGEDAHVPTFTSASTLLVQGDYVTVEDMSFGGVGGWNVQTLCPACEEAAIVLDGDHDRATNLTFDEYYPYDPNIKGATNFMQVILAGHHNRADHNRFDHHRSWGATVKIRPVSSSTDVRYSVIDRNFFGTRDRSFSNGYSLIQLGSTMDSSMYSASTMVSENYFFNFMNGGPVGENETISNKTTDNRFLYNTFMNCSQPLTLRHGKNAEVYGNFFYSNGGIRLYGEGHKIFNNYFMSFQSSPAIIVGTGNLLLGKTDAEEHGGGCTHGSRYEIAKDVSLAFNTFEDVPTPLQIGEVEKCFLPINVKIANNLGLGGGAIRYELTKDIDGNDFQVGSINTSCGTSGVSLCYKRNLLDGATFFFNEIESLPNGPSWPFIGDQVLTTFAPGAERDTADGGYLFGILTDFDGQLRPTPYDVGADEVVSGSPYVVLPSESSTGPSWW